MRLRIRDTIEKLMKEELDAALGAPRSARVGGDARATVRHARADRDDHPGARHMSKMQARNNLPLADFVLAWIDTHVEGRKRGAAQWARA